MPSEEFLTSLAAAVDADPANVDVRRLLAHGLLDAGHHAAALEHAAALLAMRPDDRDAIGVAAAAAFATGDVVRAEAYDRLAAALGPSDAPPTEPPPTPAEPPRPVARPIPALGDAVPDHVDDLLAEWSEEPAPPEPEIGELTMPTVTLSQVGGLADVKERLDRSLFAPLRNPELAAAYGASVRGGLVLYGPPGCGKTFLARAVAGELGARFYSVGLSDVLDMWIGSSERNVHSIFEVAREHAPCVLFLDEIDALGMRRTQLRSNPAMRTVVNQLLTELDGVSSNNDGIFVLAATNHPWDVDSALLRPGRLGNLVLVTPPDLEARAHILWSNLQNRPFSDVDVWAIAARTEGFSGADLREVCDRAAEAGLSASLTTGSVVPIDQAALVAALATIRPSIRAWIDTATNVARFSNTDGAYDDLVAWLRSR